MLPAVRLATLAVLLACASSGTQTSDAADAPSVIWKLDSTSLVGDNTVTVVGSPRVVVEGNESSVCFNGSSGALLLGANPIAGWEQFTIEALIKPDATGGHEQRFLHIQDEHES